jgi:aspartyl-tRNA(Asn)/glutamyl-tRNA(Gln) amidotransferase subunit C
MTTFDIHTVEKIAHLARLSIDKTAVERYSHDLSRILELANALKAIDTTNIAPMSHPLDGVQHLREDGVTETDQHEAFQAIAPQTAEGLYLVPQVIE